MTGQTTVASTGAVVAQPPQQVPMQAPGEATGGLIMTLLILGYLWYILKHKKAKPTHVVTAFVAGVLLAGSLFGLMARQVTASLGSGVATMFSTVTSSSGGSGG